MAAGRGAWLCRDSPGCLDEAVRRHGFERAFRAAIDAESLQQLQMHTWAGRGSAPHLMCEDRGLG